MDKMIQLFLEYKEKIKLASRNTIQAYKGDLYRLSHYLQAQGIICWSEVTETYLNHYIFSLEKEGFQNSSILRIIASIKSFFLYSVKNKWIEEDPTDRIKRPKIKRKEQQILSTWVTKLLQ